MLVVDRNGCASITVNGIIVKDVEAVLYLTVPLQVDRVEIMWGKGKLLNTTDIASQLVTLQATYEQVGDANVCRITNYFNVKRIVTTMHTEQPEMHDEFSLASTTVPERTADNFYHGYAKEDKCYNEIFFEHNTKRAKNKV